MLTSCRIEMYRSVHSLKLKLHRITVLLGANGSGKTNCYRALQLLHAAAHGRLTDHFAEEGGMPSALWAGRKLKKEVTSVRMSVGVSLDEFHYSLACGLPTPRSSGYHRDPPGGPSAFMLDPEVKEEDIAVRLEGVPRPVTLLERRGLVCSLRDQDGSRTIFSEPLDTSESVLSQITDPSRFSELALVRAVLLRWRFYHAFDTGRASALRQPRLGFRSPVLASDGANLAAALQTIREIGGGERLDEVLALALPGMALEIEHSDRDRLCVAMRKASIHRLLGATELSDGTLRFLCLAAALLSPRPAPFIALNEPETSLHGDLLPALAQLIIEASHHSQVLVTTHAPALAAALERHTGIPPIRLELSRNEETQIIGGNHLVIG